MKFRDKLELEIFLTEISRSDLISQVGENFVPTKEMEEAFIKRRKPLTGALKNFRRSQQTKEQWRKNRWGFMKGIKKFSRSVEGKRFHRNLGRFLSSRYFYPTMKSIISLDRDQSDKESRSVKEDLTIFGLAEILKAINSAKTHMLIELEYYMPLLEEVDYWNFLDEILPALDVIEKKLWLSERLNNDELEVLFRLTEKKELIKAFAEDTGIDYKIIENYWNEFEKDANLEEDIYLDLIKFMGEKYASTTRSSKLFAKLPLESRPE